MSVPLTMMVLFATSSVLMAQARAEKLDGVVVQGKVLQESAGKGVAGIAVSLHDSYTGHKVSTRTDQNGQYRFRGISPSIYWVAIEEELAGIWREGHTLRVGFEDVSVQDLFLAGPQSISGTVRDLVTGQPVPGVILRFNTIDNYDAVKTDDKGQYRLFGLPHKVKIYCQGTTDRWYPVDEGAISAEKVADLQSGKHIAGIDFQVREAEPIVGRIVAKDGKPLANVPISLSFRLRKGVDKNRVEFLGGGFRQPDLQPRQLKTDEKGRFKTYAKRNYPKEEGYKSFDITILARTQDGSLGLRTERTFSYPAAGFSLGNIVLQPTFSANFRIEDEKGRPLKDAKPMVMGFQDNDIAYVGYVPEIAMPKFRSLGDGTFVAENLVPGMSYGIGAGLDDHELKTLAQPPAKGGEKIFEGVIRMTSANVRSIKKLIENLGSKDQYVREEACYRLAELGPKAAEAIPVLRERLVTDQINSVRYSAATALGKIGPKAKIAVPHLVTAMLMDINGVDREAALALGRIGDLSVLKDLGVALKKPDQDVRRAVVKALGLLADKSPVAVDLLASALKDENPNVCRDALESLAKAGKAAKSAVPQIVRILQDGKPYLRSDAAKALGFLGDRSALPLLRAAMKSKDNGLFREAALAVKRIQENPKD